MLHGTLDYVFLVQRSRLFNSFSISTHAATSVSWWSGPKMKPKFVRIVLLASQQNFRPNFGRVAARASKRWIIVTLLYTAPKPLFKTKRPKPQSFFASVRKTMLDHNRHYLEQKLRMWSPRENSTITYSGSQVSWIWGKAKQRNLMCRGHKSADFGQAFRLLGVTTPLFRIQRNVPSRLYSDKQITWLCPSGVWRVAYPTRVGSKYTTT